MKQWRLIYTAVVSLFITTLSISATSAPLDKSGTLWAPYIEWEINNSTFSGNPFDLVATVTFTHPASGATHVTEMFYSGNNSWKFRFTGTKTGTWTFTTTSSDPELDSQSATITINPNPNINIKGFTSNTGNKFTRQIGENGEVEGFLFNVFTEAYGYSDDIMVKTFYESGNKNELLTNALNSIRSNGGTVANIVEIKNRWFDINAETYGQHSSENPDIRTFEALEQIIRFFHSNSFHLHIWAWGDEDRKETPIGAGGINGVPDRRLQRYIAARLGPIPGWSMGYGFDLQEWTTSAQTDSWAKYINDHSGWKHLLMARIWSGSNLGAISITDDAVVDYSYTDAVSRLDSVPNRPSLYTDRHMYLRNDFITMDWTRQSLWRYAMAGGMGLWWGRYWSPPVDYPNPEQLRAHKNFWNNRFLVGMTRSNSLTDGLALKYSNTNYVFYKENTSSIQMNLTGMAGTQSAIAIDTKKEYSELTIGDLSSTNQTWTAPYTSDWAIAVGNFVGEGTTPVINPPTTPGGETLKFD